MPVGIHYRCLKMNKRLPCDRVECVSIILNDVPVCPIQHNAHLDALGQLFKEHHNVLEIRVVGTASHCTRCTFVIRKASDVWERAASLDLLKAYAGSTEFLHKQVTFNDKT